MAKNKTKAVETEAVETKAVETEAVENVSRETSVSGTANNVGQEISALEPSKGDVISCTMTEEEHKARKERIYEIQEKCLKGSWDMMVEIASAKERKEQTLDGYNETEADFEKWALEMFGIKSTQVRQYVRILTTYGKLDDKGEYTLEDKYKRYTREKLDIIQRHPKFKTRASFDTLTDSLGITPSTSEDVLKDLVREAKGLPAPQPKTSEPKTKGNNSVKEPSVEDIKASTTYKTVVDKQALVMKLCSETYIKCNALVEKINSIPNGKKDPNIGVEAVALIVTYIEEFKAMESAYNNVGKAEEPKAEEPKAE